MRGLLHDPLADHIGVLRGSKLHSTHRRLYNYTTCLAKAAASQSPTKGKRLRIKTQTYAQGSFSARECGPCQHAAAQHSTAQHSTAQPSPAQPSPAQHSTAQHKRTFCRALHSSCNSTSRRTDSARRRWCSANMPFTTCNGIGCKEGLLYTRIHRYIIINKQGHELLYMHLALTAPVECSDQSSHCIWDCIFTLSWSSAEAKA